MKIFTFQNGDKIIQGENSNTYIGDYAHKVMYDLFKIVNKFPDNNSKDIENAYFKELIKKGLVK